MEQIIALGFCMVCLLVGKLTNRFDPETKVDTVLREHPWIDVTYPNLDQKDTIH